MDREYAALLSQVIPVVALALGLEVRAIAGRMRSTDSEYTPPSRSSFLFLLCATLFVLACAEIKALSVVAGEEFINSWTVMLIIAITVAFMAPAASVLNEISTIGREDINGLRNPKNWPILIGKFGAALGSILALALIIGTIFT